MFTKEYGTVIRWILVCVLTILFSPMVLAAESCVAGECSTFVLFDSFIGDNGIVAKQSETMASKLATLATDTFWILALIDFCWAAIIWVIDKDEMSSLMSEMIKKIMIISFFYMLLLNGPTWVVTIVKTFEVIGVDAAGVKEPTVDGLMATGFAAAKAIFKASFDDFIKILLNLPFIGLALLVAMAVIACYTIAAAQLFLCKMEAYVMLAAGAIFLAFGGAQWTKEYAEKYMKYSIIVGTRLLVLLIIIGLAQVLVDNVTDELDGSLIIFIPLLKLLVFAFIIALLAMEAPDLANALLTGGSGISASQFKSTAKGIQSAATTTIRKGVGLVNRAKGESGGNSAKTGGYGTKPAAMSESAAGLGPRRPGGMPSESSVYHSKFGDMEGSPGKIEHAKQLDRLLGRGGADGNNKSGVPGHGESSVYRPPGGGPAEIGPPDKVAKAKQLDKLLGRGEESSGGKNKENDSKSSSSNKNDTKEANKEAANEVMKGMRNPEKALEGGGVAPPGMTAKGFERGVGATGTNRNMQQSTQQQRSQSANAEKSNHEQAKSDGNKADKDKNSSNSDSNDKS